MDNQTLGKRIAHLRREQGMTQEELATCLSVTPQAVSKWENDQTCPDISCLPLLASRLRVSVDELLSGKAQPPVRVLREAARDESSMALRIEVDSPSKTEEASDRVRINIPLPLIRVALDIGLDMPQLAGKTSLKSIDFEKILALVEQGVIGQLMDIESSDGDRVRIFVE